MDNRLAFPQIKHSNLIELTVEDPNKKCGFCRTSGLNELEWGMMYQLDDIVVHYFCLILSSNLTTQGGDHEGILGFMPDDIKKELRRGQRLKCKYCGKNGATIGCDIGVCRTTFHFTCGLANDVCFQFRNSFPSYCVRHKPESVKKPVEEVEGMDDGDPECQICYSVLERKDMVWAPCCGRSDFHRFCLKKYADTSGYEFSCPSCKNKVSFVNAMRDDGIYVPERAAKWETDPGAYAELNGANFRCDAITCSCLNTLKRRYEDNDSNLWSIIPCGDCGSSATHMLCSNLKTRSWTCPVCISAPCNRIRYSSLARYRNHPSRQMSLSLPQQQPQRTPTIAVNPPLPLVVRTTEESPCGSTFPQEMSIVVRPPMPLVPSMEEEEEFLSGSILPQRMILASLPEVSSMDDDVGNCGSSLPQQRRIIAVDLPVPLDRIKKEIPPEINLPQQTTTAANPPLLLVPNMEEMPCGGSTVPQQRTILADEPHQVSSVEQMTWGKTLAKRRLLVKIPLTLVTSKQAMACASSFSLPQRTTITPIGSPAPLAQSKNVGAGSSPGSDHENRRREEVKTVLDSVITNLINRSALSSPGKRKELDWIKEEYPGPSKSSRLD